MDAWTQPTDDALDASINRMLDELGYFRAPLAERDELARRIGDSLPARVHRMQGKAWS